MPKIDFKKGFTLIELMVVISIIAILAAAGMIVYESTQASGRDGKRISDLEQISNALETYYTNNGGYPQLSSCSSGLCPTDFTSNPSNFNSDNYGTSLGSYFSGGNIPSDPNNTSYYKYFACAGSSNLASGYSVCASLENCGNKCNYNSTNGPPDPCNGATLTPGSGDMLCKIVKK